MVVTGLGIDVGFIEVHRQVGGARQHVGVSGGHNGRHQGCDAHALDPGGEIGQKQGGKHLVLRGLRGKQVYGSQAHHQGHDQHQTLWNGRNQSGQPGGVAVFRREESIIPVSVDQNRQRGGADKLQSAGGVNLQVVCRNAADNAFPTAGSVVYNTGSQQDTDRKENELHIVGHCHTPHTAGQGVHQHNSHANDHAKLHIDPQQQMDAGTQCNGLHGRAGSNHVNGTEQSAQCLASPAVHTAQQLRSGKAAHIAHLFGHKEGHKQVDAQQNDDLRDLQQTAGKAVAHTSRQGPAADGRGQQGGRQHGEA